MEKEGIQKSTFTKLESFIQRYDPSEGNSGLEEFENMIELLDDIDTQGNSKNVSNTILVFSCI